MNIVNTCTDILNLWRKSIETFYNINDITFETFDYLHVIESTYFGLGFLEDLTGLAELVVFGSIPRRSGVHLSNIWRVISGPFGFEFLNLAGFLFDSTGWSTGLFIWSAMLDLSSTEASVEFGTSVGEVTSVAGLPNLGRWPSSAPSLRWAIFACCQLYTCSLGLPSVNDPILTSIVERLGLEIIL